MNWYQLFYLMTMADRLQTFFDALSSWATFFVIVGLAWLILTTIGYSARRSATSAPSPDKLIEDDELEGWRNARKYGLIWLYTWLPICIISWFLYIATPSKKDALLIVAGGAVGTFITSDSSAKELPSDITNFLRAKIIAETKELSLEEVLPSQDTLKDLSKEQLIKLIKEKAK
jgi:Na+/H+ antiporter NhaC